MIPAGQRPPHKDIDIPTQHKPVAIGKSAAWIILLLSLTGLIFTIFTCVDKVFNRPGITRTLSPVEKAEHDRLLKRHGLSGVSVILVKDKGLFFVRDDKLNKFQ